MNIPAYEAILYRAGVPVSRHRVVVGSNREGRDPFEDRQGAINRTPVLATRVTEVVLNPSWQVPRRIKELELDPRARVDGGVYDGFELWVDSRGVERAVQLPGPRNALGRVKLVLAESGGVFLHDTPRRSAFERRARALSHGCVRVERALALAGMLLDADPTSIDAISAEAYLASGRETVIHLGAPVPIFVEYVTVGATAEGELRFYPDIYEWGPVRATSDDRLGPG